MTGGSREDDPNLDPGEAFSLLSNERRRHVVAACLELETPVELPRLARTVAARETGKEPSAVSETEYRRTYVALTQRHVEVLAEADAIEFHEQEQVITPAAHLPTLQAYLDGPDGEAVDPPSEPTPRPESVFTASVAGVGAATATWLFVTPRASIIVATGGLLCTAGLALRGISGLDVSNI